MVFSYHLCLVAFIVTFMADNGLLDFPTNFLLFFVLFANESLTARRRTHPTAAASHSPLTTGSAQ